MKKKILALCLVVALLATAIAGATLAYFTDADKDENVMVLGNVKIVQNETDREKNAYEDSQKLVPAVYPEGKLEKDGEMTDTDGETDLRIWDESIENEIDKFVSVTNKGTEPAYIRTILAFETVRSYAPNSNDNWVDLHDEFFLINGSYKYLKPAEDMNKNEAEDEFVYVTYNGVEYVLAVKVYEAPVEAGKTTTASLRQFALSPDVGNNVYDFFGPEYNIKALSQAVQVDGFETVGAEAALNEAFGEVTPENFLKWMAETETDTTGAANVIS